MITTRIINNKEEKLIPAYPKVPQGVANNWFSSANCASPKSALYK
jgi:hypothetical protein